VAGRAIRIPLGVRLKRPIYEIHRRVVKRWAGWTYRDRGILFKAPGNDLVAATIRGGPAAVGKIGESELRGLTWYLEHRDADGDCARWTHRAQRLYSNAGVFPPGPCEFSAFCREYLAALHEMDVLAVWHNKGEPEVVRNHAPQARLIDIQSLEPHIWPDPWFQALEGRRVLVVTPFVDSVRKQHAHFSRVWARQPRMAASFELDTLRVPFSAALAPSPFESWSDGLAQLRSRMKQRSFDVALIGAGAWSLPLAVHAKSLGRTGIHLGGVTQIVFGVIGRRFVEQPWHPPFFNEHWCRPSPAETPEKFRELEGGCYW